MKTVTLIVVSLMIGSFAFASGTGSCSGSSNDRHARTAVQSSGSSGSSATVHTNGIIR